MQQRFLLHAVLVGLAACRPQVDLDIVKEIFGDAERLGTNTGYGIANVLASGPKGVSNVPVRPVPVVQQSRPADYAPQPEGGQLNKATVEVDTAHQSCSDYTASAGYMCVPYYQCDKGTIITDGAGLIDVRGGFGNLSPEGSKCPGLLEVCCKDPDFNAPPPTRLVTHVPKCGRRNTAGVGARIQGFKQDESQFGEWPHMCAVLHETAAQSGQDGPANLYKCGGSLIAPGVILTAAHCVEGLTANPAAIKIRCGEWDTQKTIEPYPHQDRYVATIKTHPEFDNRSLANDFAVLFLAQDFQLDFHIDTVCLPRPNEFFVSGKGCHATGWGKDRFGAQGEYQVVLKEIELPVVNPVDCQNRLRSTRLGEKFKLHDSFMCAGGVKGKDTCKGDGGSPLVCPSQADPNVYEQAGLVAWGIGCGEDGTPGVYGSVAKAACWIDQAMTCHYGSQSNNFASYWSFDERDCGTWLDETLNRVDTFRKGGGARLAPVFDQMKRAYQECDVKWNKKADDDTSYVGVRIAAEDGGEGEAAAEEAVVTESAVAAVPEAAEAAPAEPAVDDTPIHLADDNYIPDIVGDPVTVDAPTTVAAVEAEVSTEAVAAVNFFEEEPVVAVTEAEAAPAES